MDALLPLRSPAPGDWLAGQVLPDLDGRRRLVETCRAELVWARADWMAVARTAEGWQDACLPHERAASRLLDIWGHLHPLEHRLRRAIGRLDARRRAGWDGQSTLADLQRYRHERRPLWRAFLETAADYRDRGTALRSVYSRHADRNLTQAL
jgi:hypothetical protein